MSQTQHYQNPGRSGHRQTPIRSPTREQDLSPHSLHVGTNNDTIRLQLHPTTWTHKIDLTYK